MRNKGDNSSQIYLLSLDTFMIMTVMGITLGIIFFILNPTLNSGINLNTPQTVIDLNKKDLLFTKKLIKNKYPCDLDKKKSCDIPIDKNSYLEIFLNDNTIHFTLYNNSEEAIEKNSIREEAIKKIGLFRILP